MVVVGAGLAGSEVSLRLARAGVGVDLFEMRDRKLTEAHRTGWFAEMVCSNSFGSEEISSGKGLLKEELRILGSALLPIADASRVPAGKALAVDRELFAKGVTEAVRSCPQIRIFNEEVTEIPDAPIVVLACGPLLTEPLALAIRSLIGEESFYFYDAISPIVDAWTIDMSEGYVADRYGAGSGDYLNLPMDRERYAVFLSALLSAKTMPLRDFEKPRFFGGCMPVEEIARRGPETLLFGPLRPVGLPDPRTGKIPHAVVQLRKENREGAMYNLVGFQTRMTWPEQKKVFSMIPGLGNVEFLRYGSVHRNSFLDARRHLTSCMELRERPGFFFAGQITGVEGYVESIASGLVVGSAVAERVFGRAPRSFPP
ncbi:MAG: methylenetetrahydrofolate--tRNA-(uracil(54)-C(5))-methyltransferase (FADH(2)-oxidizing) TrmFO, partial [Syntrophorhabdaceae bacterium]|nr:methylenetetrahydrofolate--tRNA-(uracil(54)-C(5))-methyltransferase (FADH(2)-oxidizing) TrmFO [Syntrophorhabdaceae bacterium]